jgi:hypothetical protein
MTSIEWLIDQLEQKGDMRETPSIRNLQLNIDTSDYLELKRQAKEMHKQELVNFYYTKSRKTFEEFFEKTFVSKKNIKFTEKEWAELNNGTNKL